MTKVVYNDCYGGFGLSDEACALYRQISGNDITTYGHIGDGGYNPIVRHDPVLVQVVEQLGERANTRFSQLEIAEVSGPYRIDEYDGSETVVEPNDLVWIVP